MRNAVLGRDSRHLPTQARLLAVKKFVERSHMQAERGVITTFDSQNHGVPLCDVKNEMPEARSSKISKLCRLGSVHQEVRPKSVSARGAITYVASSS